MTTPNHLWILPAYYNPYWWKMPLLTKEATNNSCSDEKMWEILHSTTLLFFDPVKFPPFVSEAVSSGVETLYLKNNNNAVPAN